MNWDEMAVVGWIGRPHGIRGQVIVHAETDFLEQRFHPGAEVFVERGGIEALTFTTVRFHRGRPIVGIAGIDSIEQAQPLAGLELRVPAERLVPLPAGSFYRHDLVGCRVVTSGGEPVGTVRQVEGTVTASRLVVASPGGEILIPLVSEICREIDADGKRIVIEPPSGLLDLNQKAEKDRLNHKDHKDHKDR